MRYVCMREEERRKLSKFSCSVLSTLIDISRNFGGSFCNKLEKAICLILDRSAVVILALSYTLCAGGHFQHVPPTPTVEIQLYI